MVIMKSNEDNFINTVPLWNSDIVIPIFTGLRIAPGTAEYIHTTDLPSSSYTEDHNPSGIPLYQPSYPNSPKVLKCSHCSVTFTCRDEQIVHYKDKWHQFNMKRSLGGLSPVTCDQFLNNSWEDHCDEGKESSDTSSESDDDSSNEEDIPIHRKPRIYLINIDDDLVSVYRNVVLHRKAEIYSQNELIYKVSSLRNKLYWMVLLVGGGHFSGGIFKGPDVIAHKTFHSYTVRAKQGSSQSSKDNKNATSHPKSAGASLRRYNELSYNQHVQELLLEWTNHIADCDLIFFRCPKQNNNLLFSKDDPVLVKSDTRLRTIPFPTKKPNFNEVKRVHHNLSLIYIHGKAEERLSTLLLSTGNKADKENSPSQKKIFSSSPQSKSKGKSPTTKKLSKTDIDDLNTQEIGLDPQMPLSLSSSSGSDDDETDLVSSFRTLKTDNLKSYGSWLPRKVKQNRKDSEKNEPDSTEDKENVSKDFPLPVRQIRNFVYTICLLGNKSELEIIWNFMREKDLTCVPDLLPSHIVDAIMELDESFNFFSLKFGPKQKSMLHIAAENSHKDLIWWLLSQGCDPTVLNNKGETPYTATCVKVSKLQFRRFMAVFPDKYDYKKANIPSPLSEEQENQKKRKILDKKKKQRKTKIQKEKREKEFERQKKKEEEEKEKFLKLSDREKRALAAEKRIQDSRNATNESMSITIRCFLCGKGLVGMVPFEYFEYKFCSTACVREHRIKSIEPRGQ